MSCPPSKGDPSPHHLFTLKICRCLRARRGGTEGLIWKDFRQKEHLCHPQQPPVPPRILFSGLWTPKG